MQRTILISGLIRAAIVLGIGLKSFRFKTWAALRIILKMKEKIYTIWALSTARYHVYME